MRPILLFGILLAEFTNGFEAIAEVNHALSMSVVQIHAYPEGRQVFFGSGVVIAPNRVATNCHVTRYARAIVVTKGPIRYEAVAQQADPGHDLCLLEAPGISLPVATVGSAARLRVGETIYVYGYPLAIGMAFSQGRIEALHPFDDSLIIETSADFTSGASGGGIFDDSGQLIGLATFYPAGHTGHNFAIPADWITKLSTTTAKRIEPFGGSPFWEKTERMPAFLRVPAQRVSGQH